MLIRAFAKPCPVARRPCRGRAYVACSATESSESTVSTESTSKLQEYRVLVAGATGKTGRQIVDALRFQGIPVRALVRDTKKAEKLLTASQGMEIVKGDVFQFSTLPKALGDANAIIVATGANDPADPLGPFNVDFQGTLNLVALARQKGVKKFILVSSIGADDVLNPLNLFWGVLFWKKRAEEELQRSGLDYTIIRPGGLKNELRQGEKGGPVLMKPAGFYGVGRRDAAPAGSILRSQVADVCVAALAEPEASNKVVEIIAKPDAPEKPFSELFASIH